MSDKENEMKPIWYFVGLILLIVGFIVLSAGVYYLFVPDHHPIELPGLHLSIWWGIILMIGGSVMIYANRKPVNI